MIRSISAGGGEHGGDVGAVGVGAICTAGFRQAGGAQPVGEGGVDGARAVQAFRAAAQDHRVAGLQAEAGGVGADIRAALVDHADHADRRGDALDAQPVRPRPVGQHAAERIGQRGNVVEAVGHGLDARGGQHQPVAEGRRCR